MCLAHTSNVKFIYTLMPYLSLADSIKMSFVSHKSSANLSFAIRTCLWIKYSFDLNDSSIYWYDSQQCPIGLRLTLCRCLQFWQLKIDYIKMDVILSSLICTCTDTTADLVPKTWWSYDKLLSLYIHMVHTSYGIASQFSLYSISMIGVETFYRRNVSFSLIRYNSHMYTMSSGMHTCIRTFHSNAGRHRYDVRTRYDFQ